MRYITMSYKKGIRPHRQIPFELKYEIEEFRTSYSMMKLKLIVAMYSLPSLV